MVRSAQQAGEYQTLIFHGSRFLISITYKAIRLRGFLSIRFTAADHQTSVKRKDIIPRIRLVDSFRFGDHSGRGGNLHSSRFESNIRAQIQDLQRMSLRGNEIAFMYERSRSTDVGRNLVHRPQILIQPVQRFLDKFAAWDVVTGVVKQVFFLILRRSQHVEEWFLC
jgi:hypothetical protein